MEAQARKRCRQDARADKAAAARPACRNRQHCPDCRRVTEAVVLDCGRADVMCTECKRILVGPFLATDGAASPPKKNKQHRGVKASASTDEVFDAAISGMADRLGLAAAAGDRAKEVLKKMGEANAWPQRQGWNTGRSRGPLYAACIVVACRNEGSPRALKELASAAAMTTTDGAEEVAVATSELGKLTRHIRKRLGYEEAGEASGIGVVRASSHLRRFCSLLGMGGKEAAAAQTAARRLDEEDLDMRHTGESVAAAIVCLALERAGAKEPSVKDVAKATRISRKTIHAACQNLRPHADLLFG